MPQQFDPRRTTEETQDHAPSVGSGADETVAPSTTAKDSQAPTFAPPSQPDDVGVLGPYRIVKELGRGGMGAVYVAIDSRLNRKLALKVMLPEFAADASARERFLREARAAAQITHDNVVTVYEADERDGVPYIAMQFLQGYPLDEFLKKKGNLSLSQILRIAREAAAGLAAAHRIGLVHRDVKPANLWLEAPNGRVKVLDFGLARPIDAETELTRSGAVVGTPAYMSPEQARGLKVDHRTDLFSLGVLLYRLTTGRLPFQGPTTMAVLMALGTEEPTPVGELNPNAPDSLAAFIHQLLRKKPEERPASADETAKRLREIADSLSRPGTSMEAPSKPTTAAPIHVTASSDDNPFAEHQATRLKVSSSKPPAGVPRLKRPNAEPPPPRKPKWPIVLAAGFLLPAIVAGIIIIKHRDGTKTRIEASDKSKVTIQEKNGKTVVEIESGVATSAPIPTALQFDGVDDSVRLPFAYDGTYPLTVEAWVSPARSSGGVRRGVWQGLQAIVANVEKGGVALGLDQTGRPYASDYTGESGDGFANGYAMPKAPGPLAIDAWTHLAAVYAPMECRLYVDGRRVAMTKTGKPHVASKQPFILGADPLPPDKTSYHFGGAIAGIRLSKIERYKENFAPSKSFERDVDTMALYRCDEGEGDVLQDASGNNRHGKITGAKWIQTGSASVDPDRRFAERTLELGGFVRVGGGVRDITKREDLPKGPFTISHMYLADTRVMDNDLEGINQCQELAELVLANTTITDGGLAYLKNCRGLFKLWLHGTKVTDDGLAHLKDLPKLYFLHLGGTAVTGVGLEHLQGCKDLGSISLQGDPLTDAGVARLSRLPGIADLILADTPITDAALSHLERLAALMTLDVSNTRVTAKGVERFRKAKPGCTVVHNGASAAAAVDPDRKAAEWVISAGGHVSVVGDRATFTAVNQLPAGAFNVRMAFLEKVKNPDEGLALLAGCQRLEQVYLGNSGVTDASFAQLKSLPNFTAIVLSWTKVTEASVARLKECRKLAFLHLNGLPVTDDGLAFLKELSELKYLQLADTKITDAGLVHLKGLTNLKNLRLTQTTATAKGVADLKAALPGCEIDLIGANAKK